MRRAKDIENLLGAGKRTQIKEVEVLASLLVAYPEISRATFNPPDKTLSLVFLCSGPKSVKARKALSKLYRDSVDVYLSLSRKDPAVIGCFWEKLESFYSFQVDRDVTSLSPGELNLTVDLVAANAKVISTIEESANEEAFLELAGTARLFLEETLDEVRHLEGSRRLVALREGEKVLVFDK